LPMCLYSVSWQNSAFIIIFLSWSDNCHVLFGVCTVYSSVRERFYKMKWCNVVLAIISPCDRF
jgi:hypothetical protein